MMPLILRADLVLDAGGIRVSIEDPVEGPLLIEPELRPHRCRGIIDMLWCPSNNRR
jgi:hypothetical protein